MSAVTKRAENPAPAYRRTRVGMVVFGDVTYDSRVRKEAATLANAGYEVLLVCLAADGSRADLPDNVVIRVMPAPRNAITPGLTNPFVATSPGRITAIRRRALWLLAYFRGLREWGRTAVTAAGSVDVWHAHDLTALVAVAPNISSAARSSMTRTSSTSRRGPCFASRRSLASSSGRTNATSSGEHPQSLPSTMRSQRSWPIDIDQRERSSSITAPTFDRNDTSVPR